MPGSTEAQESGAPDLIRTSASLGRRQHEEPWSRGVHVPGPCEKWVQWGEICAGFDTQFRMNRSNMNSLGFGWLSKSCRLVSWVLFSQRGRKKKCVYSEEHPCASFYSIYHDSSLFFPFMSNVICNHLVPPLSSISSLCFILCVLPVVFVAGRYGGSVASSARHLFD